MSLRKFGHGGSAIEHGDLSFHVGWLDQLANDEEANFDGPGPKQKRWEKVMDAIQLLTEAIETEGGR
jgi:hypothetical protein